MLNKFKYITGLTMKRFSFRNVVDCWIFIQRMLVYHCLKCFHIWKCPKNGNWKTNKIEFQYSTVFKSRKSPKKFLAQLSKILSYFKRLELFLEVLKKLAELQDEYVKKHIHL